MGAFVTVFCIYWAWATVGGVPAMLALVRAGDALAIGWAVFAGLGVVVLLHGISEALSHDDSFEGGSFLWSVCVIALAVYGLSHHWYLDAASGVLSRALWFGWIASNAFNIWLNLRGVGRRSAAPVVRERQAPLTHRVRRRLRLSRSGQMAEWSEAAEWYGHAERDVSPSDFVPPPRHISSLIGRNGTAPQIVYVPDEQGQLIPVQLPPGQVPVNRRLR